MVMDQELQRHIETWHSFARLMRWGIGTVLVILAGMAFFLL
jgi:hypothetical protein